MPVRGGREGGEGGRYVGEKGTTQEVMIVCNKSGEKVIQLVSLLHGILT